MKNNKITLEEFWNSKEKLAIRCKTEEQAIKLLTAFDKLGKKWLCGNSYLESNYWKANKENTCYNNTNQYSSIYWYKHTSYKIYEFEDVIIEEKTKKLIKRFVILDTGAIIDLETWGLNSWGSDAQYGITIKGNKVYETFWGYLGEHYDEINEENLLGTVVYSSDEPFYIEEACSATRYSKEPEYAEYGADLEKIFNSKKTKEDGNKEK